MSKRALITGVTGQDGSHLAELLLAKGYEVHGMMRRGSAFTTARIEHLYRAPEAPDDGTPSLHLHYGDMADATSIRRVVAAVQPDEIYNLAAQSHVAVSFQVPEYTADVTGLGAMRLFDAVADLYPTARVYQASSSEMFGASPPPQNETTPFRPLSPYAGAKVFAHQEAVRRRRTGQWIACGILFNHGGPRRGETFVERKVTRAATRITAGLQDVLWLGNLDARRDWGYAPDYVVGMWSMLQQPEPDDYVLATGESHTVRELVEVAFRSTGTTIVWREHGRDEVGVDAYTGTTRVRLSDRLLRPAEVEHLHGDASKARRVLGWKLSVTFVDLVRLMVHHDGDLAKREAAV